MGLTNREKAKQALTEIEKTNIKVKEQSKEHSKLLGKIRYSGGLLILFSIFHDLIARLLQWNFQEGFNSRQLAIFIIGIFFIIVPIGDFV